MPIQGGIESHFVYAEMGAVVADNAPARTDLEGAGFGGDASQDFGDSDTGEGEYIGYGIGKGEAEGEGSGSGAGSGSGSSSGGGSGSGSGSGSGGGGSYPEIEVKDSAQNNIADNTGSIDLGATAEGTAISHTFKVANWGMNSLTLDAASLSVPTGFSVTGSFGSTSVAPYGGFTTFTVQLDATSGGSYSGQISFNNNDSDENPFNFTISGQVNGNNAPTTSGVSDVTVDEDDSDTSINLASSFDDADIASGDSLTFSVTGNDNTGLVSTSVNGAALTLDYAADQNGTADITVRATDSLGAYVEDTFLVTVNAINDTPTVDSPLSDVSVNLGATESVIDLSGVFDDVDIATNSDSLTLSLANIDNWSIIDSTTLEGNDTFTVNYAAGQLGSANVTIRATDGAGAYVEDVFEITVTEANIAPVANDDSFEVDRDTTLTVSAAGVLVNDSDANSDPLTAALQSGPSNGSLSFLGADGSFQYIPDAGFTGTDSFTYVANDGDVDSNPATVSIVVNEVNSSPIVANPVPNQLVLLNAADLVIDVSGVFSDPDQGDSLTISLVANTNSSVVAATLSGDDLTLDFQPDQSGVAAITLQATDGSGAFVQDLFLATVAPEGQLINDPIIVTASFDGVNSQDGYTTLREAVELANSQPGADVITFGLGEFDRTIKLSQSDTLTITSDVQIIGLTSGPVVTVTRLTANPPAIRPFTIAASAIVSVTDLVIDDGAAPADGGAIHNAGQLTLERVTVTGSVAGGHGGGIYNASGAELLLANTTVTGNFATGDGGAIYNAAGADLTLQNVTFSGNSAVAGGGVYNAGQMSSLNASIVENTGSSGAAGVESTGTSDLRNTIIAANTSGVDVAGPFNSQGHNLIGDGGASSGFDQTGANGDLVGGVSGTPVIDPLIGPLQDNGGPTWTHQLLPGSPAIDGGDNSGVLQIDQRGAPRILDGLDADPLDAVATVDIGAFEFGAFFVNSEPDEIDLGSLGDGRVDVDSGAAGDQISLRAAVEELNSLAGWNGGIDPDLQVMEGVILFAPGLGALWLTREGENEDAAATGDLDVFGNLTVQGNKSGAGGPGTFLDAGWGPTTPTGMDLKDRIFHMHAGARLHLNSMGVRGGHLYNDGEAFSEYGGAIFNDGGVLEIVNSHFGESQLGRGGSQANLGGGIYTRNGSVLISGSVIQAHRAMKGGAIYVESGTLTLDNNAKIMNGGASTAGGGIYLEDGEVLITGQSEITDSFGGGAGGALYVAGGSALITGQSSLSLNNLGSSVGGTTLGGSIYNAATVVIEDGSHIDGNGEWSGAYVHEGGAIYNTASLLVKDSFIDDNGSGEGSGAGIYNTSTGVATIYRTSISRNSNNHWGTAIYNDNGEVTVVESRFVDNYNPMYAPGILNWDLDAKLTVIDSVFDGNGSENSGGGIWNRFGTVDVTGSTFVDNWAMNDGATGGGGAIWHHADHRLLGSTPERFMSLAAAVDVQQSVIIVDDSSPIENLPLPLGILVGDERMTVTDVDAFKGFLTVERDQPVPHSVADPIRTYINETQTHLTLADPGVLEKYKLPLDIVVDYEVMTVIALDDNIATVERGRNGSIAIEHQEPADVWGVAGSLTVSNSTFTGNRLVSGGTNNDFDMGGAVFNYIDPFVRPTVIESSTFDDNRGWVGAAIFTQIGPASGWFYSSQYAPEWNDEWPQEVAETIPDVSMFMQNSVVNGGFTPYTGERTPEIAGGWEGDDPEDFRVLPAESLVSGGNNLIDIDLHFFSSISSAIDETSTSLHVPEPTKGFPETPFKLRVTHLDDHELFHEEMLVTDVVRDTEGVAQSISVLRGQDGTEAIAHPTGAAVSISASGFWKPGDKHGTLDVYSNTYQTQLNEPGGITSGQTQFKVSDTTDFPETPFEIRVTHFDDLTPLVEYMKVTGVSGNTLTVERGQRQTTNIDHPDDSLVVFSIELSARLDAGLGPLADYGGVVPVQMPLAGSPLLEHGSNAGFEGLHSATASGLAADYRVTPQFYFSVDPSAASAQSSSSMFSDDDVLNVADASIFPATPFLLRIDDEVMDVTAVDVAQNTLTVVRGAYGTVTADHDSGNAIVYGLPITSNTTETFLNVADASILPPAPFVILVGDEILRVTQVDPLLSNVTVERAAFGTSPEAIAVGASAAPETYLQLVDSTGFEDGEVALIGGELLRILSIDAAHDLAIVERGTLRSTPLVHQPGVSLVHGNSGLSQGFHGDRVMLVEDVASAAQTQLTIQTPLAALPPTFDLRLIDELMKVVAHADNADGTTSLTVIRGVSGTTPAANYIAGSNAILLTDQRGGRRHVDADEDGQPTVDIGAAESVFFIVNSTADSPDLAPGDGIIDTGVAGEVTLRAAVMEINELVGTGFILLPTGEYNVGSALAVDGDIEIVGDGATITTVRGSSDRVFTVQPGGSLRLVKLTAADGASAADGGVIFVDQGELRVDASVIAGGSAARGGAIASSGGSVSVIHSTLSGNSAGDGGAVYVETGELKIRNSTISGNTASGDAGGVFLAAGVAGEILNSTIANNAAARAGGVWNEGGLDIANTVVATNLASNSEPDVYGQFQSLGGNLIGVNDAEAAATLGNIAFQDTTIFVAGLDAPPAAPFRILVDESEVMLVTAVDGQALTVARGQNGTNATTHDAGVTVRIDGFWGPGDQSGVSTLGLDPLLGPLQINYGPTPTHAIATDSPAIDAGVDSLFAGFEFVTAVVASGVREVVVDEWAAFPSAPFDIKVANQTMQVVEVNDHRLRVDHASPWTHQRGAPVSVQTDQRGAPRYFGEGSTTLDAGAFELVAELAISSAEPSKNEGDSGENPATDFIFTVTRAGRTDVATTVDYLVTAIGQHPASPADFVGDELPRGALTFAPGEMSKQIVVSVVGDQIVEGDESFQISLVNASAGAWIVDGAVDAVIVNDDSATITISSPSELEGRVLVFEVSLDAAVQGGFKLPWQTSDGTATEADGDYIAANGDLFFFGSAGETHRIIVASGSDNTVELDETVNLLLDALKRIHPDLAASITVPSSAAGDILNDDTTTLTVSNIRRLEGDSGTTLFEYTVTLAPNPVDVSFDVAVSPVDGAALDGQDYTFSSANLQFGGAADEKLTASVSVAGDLAVEPDENFSLELGTPSASGREAFITLVDGAAVILNDDGPRIVVSDIAQTELDSGSSIYTFDVVLLNPPGPPVSVDISTADDTALAGSDYVASSSTLNFSGFDNEVQTFQVQVNGDQLVELDESFDVVLSNLQASGYESMFSLVDGVGRIANNDEASLALSAVQPCGSSEDPRIIACQSEGSGSIAFRVTLTGSVDVPFTVDASTIEESAAGGVDFVESTQPLSFDGDDGETVEFAIVINNDSAIGLNNRTFSVFLSNVQAQGRRVIIGPGAASGAASISEDDAAEPAVVPPDDPCLPPGSSSGGGGGSGGGGMPIPTLVTIVGYEGPNGELLGKYVDENGNEITDWSSGHYTTNPADVPSMDLAVNGDIGYGRDLYGYAVIPVVVDGVVYLMGSVDRLNYGQPWDSMGFDPNYGPAGCGAEEEEEEEEEEENENNPPPDYSIEADWVVPHTGSLTFNPFPTFNYKLAQDVALTIADPGGALVHVGDEVPLKFGKIKINDDFTLTYTPADDLETRTENGLKPEFDAFGNVFRYSEIESFEAHIVRSDAVTPSESEGEESLPLKFASVPVELAVSNHLPVIRGERLHRASQASGAYTLDSPIYVDYWWYDSAAPEQGEARSYRLDFSQLFLDPDGEQDLADLQILDVQAGGKSLNESDDEVTPPIVDNYPDDLRVVIGERTIGTMTHERELIVRRPGGAKYLDIYSEVSRDDVQSGADWDSGPTSVSLTVVLTNGQLVQQFEPDGEPSVDENGDFVFEPHTWIVNATVRPNNADDFSSSHWRATTSAPEVDLRPWITEVVPAIDADYDPAAEIASEKWSVTAAPAASLSSSNSEVVGNTDVDLFTGDFRIFHELILDGSGGASEMALPGLTYDSSTVHVDSDEAVGGQLLSMPTVRALIKNSTGAAPDSIDAKLTWHNLAGTTVTEMTTITAPEYQSEYVIALSPEEIDDVTRVYGWELEVKLVAGGETLRYVASGETPVVVSDQQAIFGAGWALAGVPGLWIDERPDNDNVHANSVLDDRAILVFPGVAPQIFNAKMLTLNDYSYAGELPSLQPGSAAISSDGFADPQEFGVLTSRQGPEELVYKDGDGSEYVFKQHVNDNGTPADPDDDEFLYLIDRIEQPGVELADFSTTGRRGISFEWDTETYSHPVLTFIEASDGARTKFDYDAAGYVSKLILVDANDAPILLNGAAREVIFDIDVNPANGTTPELSEIRHVLPGDDAVRVFEYSLGVMKTDRWFDDDPTDVNKLARYTEYLYDAQTDKLIGIQLGDQASATQNKLTYNITMAGDDFDGQVAAPSDLAGKVELAADDLETYNETTQAGEAAGGVFVTKHEFSLDGQLKKRSESFGADAASADELFAETWTYDHVGFVKTHADPLGRETTYWYDYETPTSRTFDDPDDGNADKTPQYDPNDYRGNLTYVMTPAGQTRYEYETDDEAFDALGTLVKSIDKPKITPREEEIPGGTVKKVVTLYERATDGRLLSLRAIRGVDESDSTIAVPADDPLDYVETWKYYDTGAEKGLLELHTDARGLTTVYTYDDFRRLETAVATDEGVDAGDPADDEVRSLESTYDAFGHPDLRIEKDLGSGGIIAITDFDFGVHGQLSQVRILAPDDTPSNHDDNPILSQAEYHYEADGLLKASVDDLGFRTVNAYDHAGMLVSTLVAENATYHSVYLGQPVAIQQLTKYEYYGDGSLKSITAPSGTVERHYRSPALVVRGNDEFPTSMTWSTTDNVMLSEAAAPPLPATTTLTIATKLDRLGRVVEERNLLTGGRTEFKYDDPRHDLPTQTLYDVNLGLDRGSHTYKLETSSWTTQYDGFGNILLTKPDTVQNAAPAIFQYDQLGYLQSWIKESFLGRTGMSFVTDPAGNIRIQTETRHTPSTTQPSRRDTYTTTFKYDEQGRVRSILDPVAADNDDEHAVSIDYEFDAAERKLRRTTTDRLGLETTILVDASGRISEQRNIYGGVTRYEYELQPARNGRATHVWIDPASGDSAAKPQHTEILYDALGRERASIHHDLDPSGVAASMSQAPLDISFFTAADYFLPGDVAGDWDIVTVAPQFGNNPAAAGPAADKATLQKFDSLGNPVSVAQPSPGPGVDGAEDHPAVVTNYSYDYEPENRRYTVSVVQTNAKKQDWGFSDSLTRTTYAPDGREIYRIAPVYTNDLGQFGHTPYATVTNYDHAGRLTQQWNFMDEQGTEYYDFDPLTNKPRAVRIGDLNSQSLAGLTQYRYDSAGNVVYTKDSNQNATTYGYDAINRVVSEQARMDALDSSGNQSGSKVSLNRWWEYHGLTTVYKNRIGQTVTTTLLSPAAGQTQWSQEQIWTDGGVPAYDADPSQWLNKITTVFNSDGRIRDISQTGTIVAEGDTTTSTTAFEYDEFGRLAKETQQGQFGANALPTSIIRSYFNEFGSPAVTQVSVDNTPGGAIQDELIQRYTYDADALGRIVAVTQDVAIDQQAYWANGWDLSQDKDKHIRLVYNGDDSVKFVQRFEGTTADYSKDRGFTVIDVVEEGLSSLRHYREQGNGPIAITTITYALDGKVESRTLSFKDNIGGELSREAKHFKYDEQGRLTEVGLEDNNYPGDETQIAWTDSNLDAADDETAEDYKFQDPNRIVEDPDYVYRYDREGRLTRKTSKSADGPSMTFEWDHQGRLIKQIVDHDGQGNSNFLVVEYRYDALGRRIVRFAQTLSSLNSSTPINSWHTTYAYHGGNVSLEFDESREITRAWLHNPADNSILAVDQTEASGNRTVWTFTDMAGTIRSLATVDSGNNWHILHRHFSETGELEDSVGETSNSLLSAVLVFWQGMKLDRATDIYTTTSGVFYDPTTGRSLVDRGGVRGYVMFGNSPTDTEKGPDWELIGGPNPSGETWFDAYLLNPATRLGTGIADVVTFGGAGGLQRRMYGDAIANSNQSGAFYYTGVGLGVVGTFYLGFGAAGALGRAAQGAQVARSTLITARGVQAYMVVGDVVGVVHSSQALASGNFSAIDALGFLPTLGWAARGAGAAGRGLKAAGRGGISLAGRLSGRSAWASRALDCTAISSLDGVATRSIRRLLGECFVAGTPVLIPVLLQDDVSPETHSQVAFAGPLPPESEQTAASLSWCIPVGTGLLAAGAASLAWGFAEGGRRSKKEHAQSAADALFAEDDFGDWLADARRPLEPLLGIRSNKPFRPDFAW